MDGRYGVSLNRLNAQSTAAVSFAFLAGKIEEDYDGLEQDLPGVVYDPFFDVGVPCPHKHALSEPQ
jgi:hypothetical protein